MTNCVIGKKLCMQINWQNISILLEKTFENNLIEIGSQKENSGNIRY